MPDGEAQREADGRRLRREHNREAVVDALIGLFREGNYLPSSAEIAERAGLSPRSLFRYFEDVGDLARAAIEKEVAAARPLLAPPCVPGDPTEAKVDAVVRARVRLHASVAPAARAVRAAAPRNPVVAGQLRAARRFLRDQLESILAPELAATGRRAASVLAAVDVMCSFESYELLRTEHGLSDRQVAAVLRSSLTALLVPGP